MPAAHAAGLATCPIGFAQHWFALPATKSQLGIPRDYVPVFPLILGHPKEPPAPPGRRAPIILWR
jgi:nitroreductase